MPFEQIAQFICGKHSFTISVIESCMIRTVTLMVAVESGRDAQKSVSMVSVYTITEGDHVWNTLISDREQDGIINLTPCILYLRVYAEEFSREHPEPLQFGSAKKAAQFGADILRRPLNLRGTPYPVPYPGSAGI